MKAQELKPIQTKLKPQRHTDLILQIIKYEVAITVYVQFCGFNVTPALTFADFYSLNPEPMVINILIS